MSTPDWRFLVALGIFLVIVLIAIIGASTARLDKAIHECEARGGVLAQTRAPPYVCVQPK